MQKISALCLLSLLCLASAQLSIAPSSINFGDVQIDQTAEKIAYVINVGSGSFIMSGVEGGVHAPFQVQQDCEGTTIGPGQACRMYFYFTSNTTGSFSTVSQGTWNNYPFDISLTANAVDFELNIAPTSLNFGIIPVGESAQKNVYITNVGDVDVMVSGFAGGLEAPFDVTQSCQGSILSPGASCEMTFTFSPTTTGSATANSTGTWNGQPFNIKLTASAADIEA